MRYSLLDQSGLNGLRTERRQSLAIINVLLLFFICFFGTCICKKTSLNAVRQSDTSVIILLIPVK